MEHEDLAARYRTFAAQSAGDYAPMYRAIVAAVAEDPDLLSVAADAGPAAGHPGLLLASVRFLLASRPEHPLAGIYARRSPADVVEPFRSFVLAHRDELLGIMSVRRLQTNEIGRLAALAPALAEVERRHGRPLALLDVGASAGLNLLADRVHIDYGHATVGPVDSSLRLRCEAVGEGPPTLGGPTIGWRLGLDRRPADVGDPSDSRWLEACVWPDHPERLARLRLALSLAKAHPTRIVEGDAVEDLAPLIDQAPADHHLAITTSWTVFYLSAPRRRRLEEVLAQSGRPLSWVSYERLGVVGDLDAPRKPRRSSADSSAIGLVSYDGSANRELLAWAHNHGSWLDWPA